MKPKTTNTNWNRRLTKRDIEIYERLVLPISVEFDKQRDTRRAKETRGVIAILKTEGLL